MIHKKCFQSRNEKITHIVHLFKCSSDLIEGRATVAARGLVYRRGGLLSIEFEIDLVS